MTVVVRISFSLLYHECTGDAAHLLDLIEVRRFYKINRESAYFEANLGASHLSHIS